MKIEHIPGSFFICWYKLINKPIQLHVSEIFFIYKTLRSYPRCKLLIFGRGNDSPLWASLNKNGRTVFLENDNDWFTRLKKIAPCLEAYRVQYSTKMSDWKELIDKPKELDMDLPQEVKNDQWDIILVDGPSGYQDHPDANSEEHPGRMSSIYMATKLISPQGDIFVHDCNRQIESEYCDHFFGGKRLIGEMRGRALLKHYKW